jgi:hypothetical protein
MAIVAIYSGDPVGLARLVSATSDAELVKCVVELLLEEEQEDKTTPKLIATGRCAALRLLVGGESHE